MDAWENKPPGVFYLAELFLLIIPDPVYAVFILNFLVYSGSGIVLYLIIQRNLPSLLLSIPFTLTGLYFLFYGNSIGDGMYTESQGTLCLLLAWLLIFRENENNRRFPAGLFFAGMSFWFKEPFIIPAILLLVKSVAKGVGTRKFLANTAVFSLPSILFILILYLKNSLSGFIQMILYNFRYTGSDEHVPFLLKLESIQEHLLNPLTGLSILFLFMIYRTLSNRKSRSEAVWMLALLVSTLAPSFLSPYDFGHYYIPFYTFFFVVFAQFYVLLYKTSGTGLKWPVIILSLYACYVLDKSDKVKWKMELLPYREDHFTSILKEKPGATLFVDAVERGEYYIRTGLTYPTFVPVALPVHFNDSESGLKNRKRIWRELNANKPDYLISGTGFSYHAWFFPDPDFYIKNYYRIDSMDHPLSGRLYLWKNKANQADSSIKQ